MRRGDLQDAGAVPVVAPDDAEFAVASVIGAGSVEVGVVERRRGHHRVTSGSPAPEGEGFAEGRGHVEIAGAAEIVTAADFEAEGTGVVGAGPR